jgi:SAM-dependent methyltransferase
MPVHPSYYNNINNELLDICPGATSVVEFGCGEGDFLAAYKKRHPETSCVGVELFDAAAQTAATKLDRIICENAEQLHLNKHGYQTDFFDLMIYGDVIEHFVDPWRTLEMHIDFLAPNGFICACIPNVSHWSIIFNLINGSFKYQDDGLMDRTHLRFFTKSSIAMMFENLGLEIEFLKARKIRTKGTEDAVNQLAKLFNKPPEEISKERIQDWATYQYLIKAKKPELHC